MSFASKKKKKEPDEYDMSCTNKSQKKFHQDIDNCNRENNHHAQASNYVF